MTLDLKEESPVYMKPEYFADESKEAKEANRRLLQKDIEEFFKNGGKIRQFDSSNQEIL